MKLVLVPFIAAAGLATMMNATGPGTAKPVQGSTLMDTGFNFIASSPEVEATAQLFRNLADRAARALAALDNVTDGHPHGGK